MSFYERMLLIRRTEEKLLELFAMGLLNGTTHTSLGQEACAVGVMAALDLERDVIFSNHRCHGHFIAYGAPLELLLGEVMGRHTGACAGIGGSQHLHYRNFYSNGIQGGIVPAAAGMALAEKLKGTGAVAVVFLGDGTFGQGVVYETFNLAALWGLPILFVVEANGYAQSTPTTLEQAGRLVDRPRAFGIETAELQVTGPDAVYEQATPLISTVRAEGRPACLVLETFRLGPHSKGDDQRPREMLEHAAQQDPLNRWLAALSAEQREEAEERVRAVLEPALAAAMAAEPLPVADFVTSTGGIGRWAPISNR